MWLIFFLAIFQTEWVGEAHTNSHQSERSENNDPLSLLDKFILCDINRNRMISRSEFKDCVRFPSSTNHVGALEEIYRLFDADKDDQLSNREFELFFEFLSSKEREVDVVTSDGKKKTMRQGDFLKMEEERRRGFQYENGQVSKINEGFSEVESLRKENPELSRFVTIGKWAHHRIVQLGYASGNITGLKSINDTAESIVETQQKEVQEDGREYFEMKVELLMKESQKPKAKNVTFEVLVAWDPENYLPPYLVMKSLARVERSKNDEEETRTALECPESKRRQWPFTALYTMARFFSRWMVPLVIFCVSSLLLLAVLYLFCSPSNDENHEEEAAKRAKESKKQQ